MPMMISDMWKYKMMSTFNLRISDDSSTAHKILKDKSNNSEDIDVLHRTNCYYLLVKVPILRSSF
jgi:hypothetical protein